MTHIVELYLATAIATVDIGSSVVNKTLIRRLKEAKLERNEVYLGGEIYTFRASLIPSFFYQRKAVGLKTVEYNSSS